MAIFEKSMEVLQSWEGGYSQNPRDPGGETYCGISRKNWPNWEGWKLVDSFKDLFDDKKIPWNRIFGADLMMNNASLPMLVTEFYQNNFWNRQSFSLLSNQDVCDKIFQHYVNMGSRAIKLAQESVYNTDVTVDRVLGTKTAEAINNDTPEKLTILGNIDSIEKALGDTSKQNDTYLYLEAYCSDLVRYYDDLIEEHPQLHVFESEWKLRAKTIGKRP